MKTQTSRLIALAALSLGLLATDNGWAYFHGYYGWPNPEYEGKLGQGTASNWTDQGYANGWSSARYSGDALTMTWHSQGTLIGGLDTDTWDSGSGTFSYKLTEYSWDGTVYESCDSTIYHNGDPIVSGGVTR